MPNDIQRADKLADSAKADKDKIREKVKDLKVEIAKLEKIRRNRKYSKATRIRVSKTVVRLNKNLGRLQSKLAGPQAFSLMRAFNEAIRPKAKAHAQKLGVSIGIYGQIMRSIALGVRG